MAEPAVPESFPAHRNLLESQRKERLAVALFDLIEKERERENAIRRAELSDKIKRQHVRISKAAESLEEARMEREEAVVIARRDFLERKRRALVSIHSSGVVVRGDQMDGSGRQGAFAVKMRAGGGAPRKEDLKPLGRNKPQLKTFPNSSFSLAADSVQASKMSLFTGTTNASLKAGSTSSPMASAAGTRSMRKDGLLSHAESLTVVPDPMGGSDSQRHDLHELRQSRSRRPRKVFRGQVYKRQVEMIQAERSLLATPLVPISHRYDVHPPKPKKRRNKPTTSPTQPGENSTALNRAAKRIEMDAREIMMINKKKFKSVQARTQSKIPPITFKEHGGMKMARSRCVSERRDRGRHNKPAPPSAAVLAIFQTETSFKEFKARYQRPFTADTRDGMESIETVKDIFTKRLSRKRLMWEQAQKNRHRTLTFSYGGGATGEHAINASGGIMGGPFATHLLHNARPSIIHDEIFPPPSTTPEASGVPSTAQPERRRSISMMSINPPQSQHSSERRSSSVMGWVGQAADHSGGYNGGQNAGGRLSPVSQGRSVGGRSHASTEKSIEIAISLANSKLASSRRGGLLSAVRDEPSTRATSSRAPYAGPQPTSSLDGELNSPQKLHISDHAEASSPLPISSSGIAEAGGDAGRVPANLFEPEGRDVSPPPPLRYGSGGLARGGPRIGSAGRVTFQKKSDAQDRPLITHRPMLPKPIEEISPQIPGAAEEPHLSTLLDLPLLDEIRKSKEVPLSIQSSTHHMPRTWQPLGVTALSEKAKTIRPTAEKGGDGKMMKKLRMRPQWAPGKSVFNHAFQEPSATALAADAVAVPAIMRVWTGQADYEGY
ncbi:hypothetical protein HDU67_000630 [Dinochytrium kinnereticum]|nr:hypothetical protein HDU67_000630 [Dinochytrium kinnereticum]